MLHEGQATIPASNVDSPRSDIEYPTVRVVVKGRDLSHDIYEYVLHPMNSWVDIRINCGEYDWPFSSTTT